MKRAKPLIPLSRFHKKVLFVAESCKTDGARFKGYPIDVVGRLALLVESHPKLTSHFSELQSVFSALKPFVSDELQSLFEQLSSSQNELLAEIEKLSGLTITEYQLNKIGTELVQITRLCERGAFQQIQEEISEDVIKKVVSSLK